MGWVALPLERGPHRVRKVKTSLGWSSCRFAPALSIIHDSGSLRQFFSRCIASMLLLIGTKKNSVYNRCMRYTRIEQTCNVERANAMDKQRIQVVIDAKVLKRIDVCAAKCGMNRSQFIETFMEVTLESEEPVIDFVLELKHIAKFIWPAKGKPKVRTA